MSAYVRGWMDVGVYCMHTGAGVWGRMSSVLIAFVRRWRIGGYCLVSYPDPTDISLMCNTMSSGSGNQEVVLWHTKSYAQSNCPIYVTSKSCIPNIDNYSICKVKPLPQMMSSLE